MKSDANTPKTIDEYIASFPLDIQEKLIRLERQLKMQHLKLLKN